MYCTVILRSFWDYGSFSAAIHVILKQMSPSSGKLVPVQKASTPHNYSGLVLVNQPLSRTEADDWSMKAVVTSKSFLIGLLEIPTANTFIWADAC